jgi:hypothetical protein
LSNAAVFILLQQTDSCHDHSERRRNALALSYQATFSSCDSYAALSGGGFGTLGTSFSARINQDLAKTIVKSALRTASMNIPNFHDGYFDGLRIGPNKLVNLFLRTQERKSFILVLQDVDSMTISEIKQGNIILDLVFRSSEELTRSDMAELYSVDVDAPQAADLLTAKREEGFQLLEINGSYGAQGSVLFQTFEIRQSTAD